MNTNLKQQMIKQQACFSRLTETEIEELSTLFNEVAFKAGETIVTEGDPVDSVYLIISGTADVRHVTIENNALKIESLATLGPGNAIGLNEHGFYSISGVRTATVVANEDMTLLHLSVAAFHGFALVHPHVIHEMRRYVGNIVSSP